MPRLTETLTNQVNEAAAQYQSQKTDRQAGILLECTKVRTLVAILEALQTIGKLLEAGLKAETLEKLAPARSKQEPAAAPRRSTTKKT